MNDNSAAAVRWRKSTYSNDTGDCVEVATWRKSIHSNAQGGCVEVGVGPDVIAVRDSKDPNGPVLTFSTPAWQSFLSRLS